ncbi:hypothetical protein EV207_1255 [Scopulibacillus darangshiensis]|uniref:DUF5640 domain-containing protein n=1 Tax=Scopulibacillus darangshiensis TaxID=442528 RepID=A0A4R2NSS5_9BACL|nr:hypothetical protein [Scopulibacillus darangshiensis]TCP24445.1 hypothetical protein EV207_1255 [Scopulibacillus darangshiensis]
MKKYVLILFGLSVMLILSGCSNIEKDIVGHWKVKEDDEALIDEGSDIRLNDDMTIEGFEGYKTYKVEEVKDKDYDYLILSGGYDETKRLQIKMKDKDTLSIHEKGTAGNGDKLVRIDD